MARAVEILQELSQHVWNYNGTCEFRAKAVGRPIAAGFAAAVCVTRKSSQRGPQAEQEDLFECQVMGEIRQMFAGVCNVIFVPEQVLLRQEAFVSRLQTKGSTFKSRILEEIVRNLNAKERCLLAGLLEKRGKLELAQQVRDICQAKGGAL